VKKINFNHLPHRRLGTNQKPYSLSLNVIEALGFAVTYIHHEILEPQHRSSAPHAHSHQHEAIYLLQGVLHVRVNQEICSLAPGECICFDLNESHEVSNQGKEDAHYLIFAESHPDDHVLFAQETRLT
jgi:uncharacterized cupin superfamily protein